MSVRGTCGHLVVSALDSGLSPPGFTPAQGQCCVLKKDTFLSQCLSRASGVNG